MIPYLLDKVWIIPALMGVSFLAILFFGKRLGHRATSGIGIVAVGLCFVLSLLVAGQWIDRVNHPPESGEATEEVQPGGEEEAILPLTAAPTATGTGEVASGATELAATEGEGGEEESVPPVVTSVPWFTFGGVEFDAGTLVDGLTAMMLVTVTLISLLVHIYSTEYLRGDIRYTHYYAFLSLFTASMLFYVISSNTLQMLVGWELVGLCSFALIGHWWEEKKNSDAALKAFFTNRVGDVGLILGVIITFFAAGATSFGILHINEYALFGRMTAVLEAIFGQLYLITVVALVVQNLGQKSRLGRKMEEEFRPDSAGTVPAHGVRAEGGSATESRPADD